MRRFYWLMAGLNLVCFIILFGAGIWEATEHDYSHATFSMVMAAFAMYWNDYFMGKL